MNPSSRSKVEKMKTVAALQNQKGPWSHSDSSSLGGREKKKELTMQQQTLQQQKGPWSRRESSSSNNYPKPLPPATDPDSHSASHSPRQTHRRSPNSQYSPDSPDYLGFDGSLPHNKNNTNTSKHYPSSASRSSPPRPPPPPPPKSKSHTHSTSSNTGRGVPNRLDTPQNIICFCTAMSLFRKQWDVLSFTDVGRCFYKWKQNLVASVTSSSHSGIERSKNSVLLCLATNSRTKSLRNAWKKWMFAVVSLQCQDKNAEIENISMALCKENEQYKLRLKEIMEKVRERDESHRQTIANTTLINSMQSFFRIKRKIALKRRFDRWSRLAWQQSYDQTLKREKYKMEIGFQAISSEQEVKEESRIHSFKLQSTLLCLVAFSSWKLKMKEEQFKVNQKQWATEKQIIQDNLLSLQKSLLGLNRTEREMVQTARTRGMEMFSSLHAVSEKLERCSSSLGGAALQHGRAHSPGNGHTHDRASKGGGGSILKKTKKKLLFEEIK